MKKILVIVDYIVKDGQMERFREFEKYGYLVEFVRDRPEITDHETFSQMFLQFEKYGPDVLPVNQEMAEKMRDAEIVISHISAVSSQAIRQAECLKAICIMRSGVENINLKTAAEKGIRVINSPGRLAVPVSEFTVGLIISEMKNIARSHRKIYEHDFGKDFPNSAYSYNICDKQVGLVGGGMVGRRVAAIMNAFGAHVLIYDPYMTKDEIMALGCEPAELNELCRKSDVISVHYRLTDETRNMIGREQFALMKPTCFFINTARAGLVEEEALLEALQQRKIGGAGLDVFHQEPLPSDHPFFKLDNVTMTAHLAGTSADIFEMTYRIMADTLRHYMETGEWLNAVI
ncbi:2-hydroxyacid dehydrogenase [Blautia schinkii]|nr:2-hydroxyacid dehydrogenase [Blautia schinkii]